MRRTRYDRRALPSLRIAASSLTDGAVQRRGGTGCARPRAENDVPNRQFPGRFVRDLGVGDTVYYYRTGFFVLLLYSMLDLKLNALVLIKYKENFKRLSL